MNNQSQVIELDNKNSKHCLEQLKNDEWTMNVLLLYVNNSPETDHFRKIYEQVAREHPYRNLFALNIFDSHADAKENQLIWETVKGCLTNMWSGQAETLGIINANTPAVLLYDYGRIKVDEHSTKETLLKFIGEWSKI